MQDTIDVAIQLGLIDNSVLGTFKLIDLETGELIKDSAGNDIKIRGKKNIRPYFEANPQAWAQLYNKVYEKIAQKDDPNILAFENMLNLSSDKISETFNIDFAKESSDD